MDNDTKLAQIAKRLSDQSLSEKEAAVSKIIEAVISRGDSAVKEYTEKFDKQKLESFKVESKGYLAKIKPELKAALETAKDRITTFHEHDLKKDWDYKGPLGERLGAKYVPIDSVAVYVPGGSAPLVSTVLMTAVPAKVAGVERVVMISPPPINDAVLAAAELAGVDEVYSIGGAQAIAALAYGTETIHPVDKIVGPGNIFVSLAKKKVFGKVGIDGIYGPSELAILADETAKPKSIALDLLSQLEHGSGLESVLLVTTSGDLAEKVKAEFINSLSALNKSKEQIDTIQDSFENWSAIIEVATLEEGADVINSYAPEHFELQVADSKIKSILALIRNAAAIFVGANSCESLGDYLAGPSHCLPTGGTARFSSGLQSSDFVRKVSLIDFSKVSAKDSAYKKLAEEVAQIARAEELEAHAQAMEVRLEE